MVCLLEEVETFIHSDFMDSVWSSYFQEVMNKLVIFGVSVKLQMRNVICQPLSFEESNGLFSLLCFLACSEHKKLWASPPYETDILGLNVDL